MTAGALSPLLGEFQIHTRDAPNALHLFVIRPIALQCSAASGPRNPESRLNKIDYYVQSHIISVNFEPKRHICSFLWGHFSFRAVGWAGKSLLLPWRQGNPNGRKRAQLLFRGPVAKRWEGSFCAQPHCPETDVKSLCAILHLRHFCGPLPHSHPVIMG